MPLSCRPISEAGFKLSPIQETGRYIATVTLMAAAGHVIGRAHQPFEVVAETDDRWDPREGMEEVVQFSVVVDGKDRPVVWRPAKEKLYDVVRDFCVANSVDVPVVCAHQLAKRLQSIQAEQRLFGDM